MNHKVTVLYVAVFLVTKITVQNSITGFCSQPHYTYSSLHNTIMLKRLHWTSNLANLYSGGTNFGYQRSLQLFRRLSLCSALSEGNSFKNWSKKFV